MFKIKEYVSAKRVHECIIINKVKNNLNMGKKVIKDTKCSTNVGIDV